MLSKPGVLRIELQCTWRLHMESGDWRTNSGTVDHVATLLFFVPSSLSSGTGLIREAVCGPGRDVRFPGWCGRQRQRIWCRHATGTGGRGWDVLSIRSWRRVGARRRSKRACSLTSSLRDAVREDIDGAPATRGVRVEQDVREVAGSQLARGGPRAPSIA